MALSAQFSLVLAVVGVVMMASLWQPVASHGRLWTPPGRSTMWRKGFHTPKNWDDDQLYCGGLEHQKSQGYKCGVCGDPYDSKRPNEAGGKYATGTIAGTYQQGQHVTLQVDLTTSHRGWFEFKLCPVNDYKKKATQACLDAHVLQLANGKGSRFPVPFGENAHGIINIPVVLPAGLQCSQCVLQWRYHAANNWDFGPDGKGCQGCGPQEEFYGCADIKILPGGSAPAMNDAPAAPAAPAAAVVEPEPEQPPTRKMNEADTPKIFQCEGLLPVSGLENWCNMACNMQFCPVTHCRCQEVADPRAATNLAPGCYATTPFSNVGGLDGWCTGACKMGSCPKNKCFCV